MRRVNWTDRKDQECIEVLEKALNVVSHVHCRNLRLEIGCRCGAYRPRLNCVKLIDDEVRNKRSIDRDFATTTTTTKRRYVLLPNEYSGSHDMCPGARWLGVTVREYSPFCSIFHEFS